MQLALLTCLSDSITNNHRTTSLYIVRTTPNLNFLRHNLSYVCHFS